MERVTPCLTCLVVDSHAKELVAKHCCLTSESIFGIVQMCRIQPQQQCLVTLDLGFNRIGFAGVQNIAKMLEKNATLTTLGLAGNRIDTAGAEVLSASLRKNETLLHLNLFMNDLDIGGVRFPSGSPGRFLNRASTVPPLQFTVADVLGMRNIRIPSRHKILAVTEH